MQFFLVALPGGLLHPFDLFFVGIGVCGLEVLHLMVRDWEFAGGLDYLVGIDCVVKLHVGDESEILFHGVLYNLFFFQLNQSQCHFVDKTVPFDQETIHEPVEFVLLQ